MDPSGLDDAPAGPKIFTFTFRSPFLFGFDHSLGHVLELQADYVDETDEQAFHRGG